MLTDAPRARLLREFAAWLEPRLTDLIPGLPGAAIRVTVVSATSLPGGNIGVFCLGSRATPARRWEVRLAYGGNFHASHLPEAWLATLPHELFHLRDFAQYSQGVVPIDCDWEATVGTWIAKATASEADVEASGNEIVRDGYAPGRQASLTAADLYPGLRTVRALTLPQPATAGHGASHALPVGDDARPVGPKTGGSEAGGTAMAQALLAPQPRRGLAQ
jgi:hypothetical protein